MRLLMIAVFLASTTIASAQRGQPTMRGIVGTTQRATACDLLNQQLVAVQRSPEAARAFVVAFWQAEAAKLRLSLDQYAIECERYAEAFNRLVATLPPQ